MYLNISQKIKSMVVVGFLLLSPVSYADGTGAVTPVNTSLINTHLHDDILGTLPMYTSIDDAFAPLQNRLILSLFGRVAASAALDEQLPVILKEDILNMSSADVGRLVDPFPSSAAVVVSLVFRVLYTIAFSFWVYIFSSFIFNKLFSKHTSELDGGVTRMGVAITSLRSFIVMALCVPIFSENLYSKAHIVGFKMIGKALGYAQLIDNQFSFDQKLGAVAYVAPKPTWYSSEKTESLQALTNFANCVVRGGKGVSDIKYSPSVTDEISKECSTRTDIAYCNKTLSYSASAIDNTCSLVVHQDIPNGDMVFAKKKTKDTVNVDTNAFIAVSKDALENTVKTLVGSAVSVGKALVDSSASSLDKIKYSSDSASSRVFSDKDWFKSCNLQTNTTILDQIRSASSLGDLKAAVVNQELCEGAYLIKRYGNPTSDYDETTVATNRYYKICESGVGANSCAEKACKQISKDGVTKLFSCAEAAVDSGKFYDVNMLRKMGFLVTPSLIASDVSGVDIPISLQGVLNGFDIWSKTSANNFTDMEDKKNIRILREKSNLIFEVPNDAVIQSSKTLNNKIVDTAIDGGNRLTKIMGFQRFYGCITGGGQYKDGGNTVICSSNLVEIHRFGMRLLRAGVVLQLGSLSRKLIPEKSENGVITPKRSKLRLFWNGIRRVMPVIVAGVAGTVFSNKLLLNNLVSDNSEPYGLLSDEQEMLTLDSLSAFGIGFLLSPPEGGSSSKMMNGSFSLIRYGFFGAGLLLGIIIPLTPMFLFYFAIIAAFANFTSAMIALNFHILYALAGVGNDVVPKLRKLVSKWLLILMRIPMLVVGFWMSMYILDGCLPTILSASTLSARMVDPNVDFLGIVTFLVILIVWSIMFYITVFTILDSVTGVYLTVKSLVFEDDSSEFSGNTNSASKVSGIKREVKGLIKN